MYPDDKDWQAQDDARTLARAHEIKSDGERHSKAKAHAAEEAARLKKVAGGRGPSAESDIIGKGYRKL